MRRRSEAVRSKKFHASFSISSSPKKEETYLIDDKAVSKATFDEAEKKYASRYGSAKEIGYEDGFPLTAESIDENCK